MESNLSTFTDNSYIPVSWTFPPIAALAAFLLTVISNSIVLATFCQHRLLSKNPFMIYLLNLLLANLIYALLAHPINIYGLLRYRGYEQMAPFQCLYFQYANYVGTGIVRHTHALVTVNRLWAIIYPVSYRNQHTRMTAFLICGLMWLYVHCIVLYVIVKNEIDSLVDYCDWRMEKETQWRMVVLIVVYNFPVFFTVLAYPFLWLKRRRFLANRAGSKRYRRPFIFASADDRTRDASYDHDRQNSRGNGEGNTSCGFHILTLLTISVCIFWAIPQSFMALRRMGHFGFSEETEYLVERSVPTILYPLQSVADAILFTFAIPELRACFASLMTRSVKAHTPPAVTMELLRAPSSNIF